MSWLQQRSDRVDADILSAGRTAGLVLGLFVVALAACMAPGVVAEMEALYAHIDLDQPYLSGLAPGLLYLRMPLASLGACIAFLLPGAMLALGLDLARTWSRLVMVAFGIGIVLSSGAGLVMDAVAGRPHVGVAYVLTQLGLSALCTLPLVARVRTGRGPRFRLNPGPSALGLLALPVLLLIALTPKLFWEAANDDGNQILEVSRLLLHQGHPFLGPEAGAYRAYPGVNMMLAPYPLSVFVRMLGVHMAAVRVPIVLLFAALYAVIVELGEAHRPRLRALDHLLLGLSLCAFTLTMSYSATWDPYSADIGLPATQDTLMMFLFLAAVLALLDGQRGWALGYASLLVLCSPNGLALLAMFAFAVWLSSRHQTRPVLLTVAGGVVFSVVVLQLAGVVAVALGAPTDSEHSAGNLAGKMLEVSPFEFRRVLFMLLPSGIYPVVVLARLRKADDVTRALALVALANFAVFYLLTRITLHYFVPSMVLPVAAFFRHFRCTGWALPTRSVAAAAAVLAVVLCLPRSTGIYSTTRDLGAHLDVSRASGYWQSESRIFGLDEPFQVLFPADYNNDVPEKQWGGSWRAIRHYAELGVGPDTPKNYFLTDPGEPVPRGTTLVASNDNGAIYVRDEALWQAHRHTRPRVSTGHDFFIIPRPVLFGTRYLGEHVKFYVLDKLLLKRPVLGFGALAIALLAAPFVLIRIRRYAMAQPVAD